MSASIVKLCFLAVCSSLQKVILHNFRSNRPRKAKATRFVPLNLIQRKNKVQPPWQSKQWLCRNYVLFHLCLDLGDSFFFDCFLFWFLTKGRSPAYLLGIAWSSWMWQLEMCGSVALVGADAITLCTNLLCIDMSKPSENAHKRERMIVQIWIRMKKKSSPKERWMLLTIQSDDVFAFHNLFHKGSECRWERVTLGSANDSIDSPVDGLSVTKKSCVLFRIIPSDIGHCIDILLMRLYFSWFQIPALYRTYIACRCERLKLMERSVQYRRALLFISSMRSISCFTAFSLGLCWTAALRLSTKTSAPE